MTAKPNIAGEHRDRYLLLLSLISVTFVLLMLVDFAKLDTLTSDALVIAVTVLTAAMLLAALWTSAASRRLVAVAGFVGGVSVVAAVVTMFTEEAYRPSFLWVPPRRRATCSRRTTWRVPCSTPSSGPTRSVAALPAARWTSIGVRFTQ